MISFAHSTKTANLRYESRAAMYPAVDVRSPELGKLGVLNSRILAPNGCAARGEESRERCREERV